MLAVNVATSLCLLVSSPVPRTATSRTSAVRMEQSLEELQSPTVATEALPVPMWQLTGTGLRFQDKNLGAGLEPESGTVVKLHYTVSFQSGQELGTSRPNKPLTFLLGKHDVGFFTEAVEGMRTGGQRRLAIPFDRIPRNQLQNVPKDQEGESLIVELELLGIETGVGAIIPSLLPPGNRRQTIARAAFALSFLPYLLPDDIKPEMFQFGDPVAIGEARREAFLATRDSLWLGGAADSLDSLFQ